MAGTEIAQLPLSRRAAQLTGAYKQHQQPWYENQIKACGGAGWKLCNPFSLATRMLLVVKFSSVQAHTGGCFCKKQIQFSLMDGFIQVKHTK